MLFTAFQLKEISIFCLKGEHPLTKISDLKVHTLSFRSYFYSSQKPSEGLEKFYIKKLSPNITEPIPRPPSGYIFARYRKPPYVLFRSAPKSPVKWGNAWDCEMFASFSILVRFSHFSRHKKEDKNVFEVPQDFFFTFLS